MPGPFAYFSAVRVARALFLWAAVTAVICRSAAAADIAEATAMYKAGRYAQCVAAAQEAIDADQFSETWRILKIQSELAGGHYETALATLDAALERYKTSVRLRWWGSRVCRLNNQPERAAELLDQIDELTDGFSWRYSDPASRVVLGRYYLERGADAKQVMEAVYNWVKNRTPSYTEAYIAAGQLALDKNDYSLAADEFTAALRLDGTDPEIHFGLARAFAPSDPAQAQQHLEAALARNPHHVDSMLFQVDHLIDAERYDEADQRLLDVLAVNARQPRAWAYLAVLAHLRNDLAGEHVCRNTALSWWQQDPQVDYLIGNKLSQKYRFAEGAAYQRQALALDADYLPAKLQLCQDLLRLGEEAEGLRLASEVFDRDGYNVVAHNLVTLQDNLSRFRTLPGDGFLVRMESREAELYGPRVLALLARAKRTLCAKYDVALEQPVLVEIFPRQSDFAIRTFGLPGGDGFLGVCFGRVITANSPAARPGSPSNWEAVLWHEFCHVVTLEKTRNKMPRWLSEGISVYEERQADPTWGQTMIPAYRTFILGAELTPVSQLSGAFLQPPTPEHLQFAYYESSLVVEYLIERYGLETLQRILVDLGAGMSINDSLARYTGSLAALDAEFADYARQRARQLAPDVDWTPADLPRGIDAATLATWLEVHPHNFTGLLRYAALLVEGERWAEAKQTLEKLIELYPEYHEADNAYALLAAVHRRLNETQAERAVLQQLAALSGEAVDAYLRLMELAAEDEDWEATVQFADRMLAVNPLIAAPHRFLALAADNTGDDGRAIEALRALLVLDPLDPADLHYRLGRSLLRAGDLPRARRQTLKSLEEAPRFRAAHRQLLEILARIDENEGGHGGPSSSTENHSPAGAPMPAPAREPAP